MRSTRAPRAKSLGQMILYIVGGFGGSIFLFAMSPYYNIKYLGIQIPYGMVIGAVLLLLLGIMGVVDLFNYLKARSTPPAPPGGPTP